MPDLNYPAFHAAEDTLRWHYPEASIFNPARAFDGDKTRDIRDYFHVDFKFLVRKADTIAFLPGWQGSEGSLIEHGIARALELDFLFMERPQKLYGAQVWPEHAPVAYEAHRLVFGDRGTAYGHPAKNFDDIAEVWNAHLGTKMDATDVASLMTLFKIARGKSGYKRDNVIDAIGYQIAGQRVVDGK